MNAPLWILVFQKAFEATIPFVFSIDGANQHFSWLPLFHLLLNLLHIWHLHNIWRFSKQTNLSNISEVMWSAPYNFGGFLRRQAHKLAAPPKCQNLETKFIFMESECCISVKNVLNKPNWASGNNLMIIKDSVIVIVKD